MTESCQENGSNRTFSWPCLPIWAALSVAPFVYARGRRGEEEDLMPEERAAGVCPILTGQPFPK